MRISPYPKFPGFRVALCVAAAGLYGAALEPTVLAQLPATAPTAAPSAVSSVAPLTATPDTLPSHHPEVTCNGGLLTVHANNSSLNGILRAISRCTGMRILGGVGEQRVFGDYGPAAPATVLATLIDGTGTNMLLRETAADQPADLILTPRAGGATPPPSPSSFSDDDDDQPSATQNAGRALAPGPQGPYGMRSGSAPLQRPGLHAPSQTMAAPANEPQNGSAVTSPPSIPQPFNNVNGSPSNTSPTAATYPTTNSVPLDSVATPSTTPPANGIVDAPNPPPAGSDTAAAMNGNQGANGANTGTQTGAQGGQNSTSAPTDLTPEQIFQQLQQRQQQQQQQQQTPQPSGGPIIGGTT